MSRAARTYVWPGNKICMYTHARLRVSALPPFPLSPLVVVAGRRFFTSPNEQELVGSLGAVQPPRAGMSSQLGIYTRTGGKTHLCSACDDCDLKDYTGSYHVSISLPHDPEGWVVYNASSLSEDGSTCSETYARGPGNETETPLSVWVEAHKVCFPAVMVS